MPGIDPFFGSVLGAVGDISGGLIGHFDAGAKNRVAAAEAQANRAEQQLLAREGIQMRAADVLKAYHNTGIHPLALLGVQGPTYSPVSTAFTASPLGQGIAAAGQDISRGIHATADRELRGAALAMQEAALKQSAERGALENELLRVQIMSARQRLAQQSGPPVPSPLGFSGDPRNIDASKMIMGNPDWAQRSQDAGISFRRFAQHPTGGQIPAMGKEYAESTEDSWIDKLAFAIDQRLLPIFGLGARPPREARKGWRWTYRWDRGWKELPESRYGHVRPKGWDTIPGGMP